MSDFSDSGVTDTHSILHGARFNPGVKPRGILLYRL